MFSLPELLGPDSPGVRLIAASTLHGSATVHGTSQPLGNAHDAGLLQALRDWSDAIVVGHSTAAAEGYGPPAKPDTRLAILSASLEVDREASFLTAGDPLILTPSRNLDTAAANYLREAGHTLIGVGEGAAAEILAALRRLGLRRIAVEGGPHIYSLFAQEASADLLYLTLDPRFGPSVETPLVQPGDKVDPSDTPAAMKLEHACSDSEGMVFLRYRFPTP